MLGEGESAVVTVAAVVVAVENTVRSDTVLRVAGTHSKHHLMSRAVVGSRWVEHLVAWEALVACTAQMPPTWCCSGSAA